MLGQRDNMGNAISDHTYSPPSRWLAPTASFRKEFARWTWYPNGSMKIKRSVSYCLDQLEVYDGAVVHKTVHTVKSVYVFSLYRSDQGWKLDMWHEPSKGKWNVRDVSVKILGMSTGGLYAKVRLTTRDNSGAIILSYEHVFWRHRYI